MNNNTSSDITHFSTDALPERDRMAIWREVFGRHIIKVQVEPIPNTQFIQTANMRRLPGISLVTSESAGVHAVRTRQLVAEGNDDLTLTINTAGVAHASQLGREAIIESNEGVFFSAAETGAIRYPTPSRFVVFRMPRNVVAPAVGDLEARLARRLPQTEVLRLLMIYTAALDKIPLTSSMLRETAATHIQDLIILAIDASGDAAEAARGRGLRAARLKAIKDDILSNIANENLSVAAIARRHCMTPRYVQLLFEADGRTFSEYVVELRLERAYRMLGSAKFSGRTIGAIAFEVGYSNLSYFNRTFRRRYGATPSDVREAAARRALD
jgi:AraC-like DNA-binding protein